MRGGARAALLSSAPSLAHIPRRPLLLREQLSSCNRCARAPYPSRSLVLMAEHAKNIPCPNPALRGAGAGPATASVPAGYQTITEGAAVALYKRGKVFYNQVQIFNRDLSIMTIRSWDEMRCAEGTSKDARRAWTGRGPMLPPRGSPVLPTPPSSADGAAAAAASSSSSGLPPPLSSFPPGSFPMPPMRILEALSASGLRSMRYAKELPRDRVEVIVTNDLEEAAVEAIQANIAFNGLAEERGANGLSKLVVANAGDAALVMYLASRGVVLPGLEWMRRPKPTRQGEAPPPAPASPPAPSAVPADPFFFDVIDLDPYGTASPFLDAAVQAVGEGGLLAVTCTDMAVLAGNNMDICHTKYGSVPVKARYYNEQALRIVIASVESAANRYKRTVTPLLSVSVDFYVRIFLAVHTAPSAANEAPAKLGNVYQCTGCDAFWLWPLGKGAGHPRGLFVPPHKRTAGAAGAAAAAEAAAAAPAAAAAMATDEPAAPQHQQQGPRRGEKVNKVEKRNLEEREREARQADAVSGASRVSINANTAPDVPSRCPHCGRRIIIGGPMWLDPIHDHAFAKRVLAQLEANFGMDGMGGGPAAAAAAASSSSSSPSSSSPSPYSLAAPLTMPRPEHDGGSNDVATVSASRRRLMGVVRCIVEEAGNQSPLYYELPSLASRLRISNLPLTHAHAALLDAGYTSTGSHCSPNVVKTDAPPEVVWDIMREWARQQGKTVGSGAGAVSASSTTPAPAAATPVTDEAASWGHLRALAETPLHEALLSVARQSTEAQLPSSLFPMTWRPNEELKERRRVAALAYAQGGRRFVPNPEANWGPKSRAHGGRVEGEGEEGGAEGEADVTAAPAATAATAASSSGAGAEPKRARVVWEPPA
jgi:tRNA G26 N,N-dimethylase Trm1